MILLHILLYCRRADTQLQTVRESVDSIPTVVNLEKNDCSAHDLQSVSRKL